MIEKYHDDHVGTHAGESVRTIALQSASREDLASRLSALREDLQEIELEKEQWDKYLSSGELELFASHDRKSKVALPLPAHISQSEVDTKQKELGDEWRRVKGSINEIETALENRFPDTNNPTTRTEEM